MEGNNTTMAEMLEQMESEMVVPRRGNVYTGKVVQVNDDNVVVNVGYKADGIIPLSEMPTEDDFDFKSEIHEGDEIDVYIDRLDDGEGNVRLSLRKVSMLKDWDELEDFHAKDEEVEVLVTKVVKGGVIAYYKEVRGFIPASHLAIGYVKDLTKFKDQTLNVKIIELNKRRKKVVFSRKLVAKEAQREMREEFWDSVEVGQIIEGEVKRITNFGAFVDVGGVDGLIHVSEMTWGRMQSPKEFFTPGEKVQVKVLSFDQEEEKISLSTKQVKADPWTTFEENFTVGETYMGRVVNLTDFGAFIELEPGIEGLVHISQIAHERIDKPSDRLRVGEQVEVKLLETDLENRKIRLSIKETLEDEEETTEEA